MSDPKEWLQPPKSSLGAKLLRSKQDNRCLPPTSALREVGKLAVGVAGVAPTASGSATGNPRNKCALEPGHSLMDWVRLGASGKDLTEVGPKAGTLSITPRELAEHNTRTDAWIAIRGHVYNITHYLPFHPGGADELMRGVGKDATKLFDQIHAWVNYQSLLQKCLIGRLCLGDATLDITTLFGSDKESLNLRRLSTSVPTSPTRTTGSNNQNISTLKNNGSLTVTSQLPQEKNLTDPQAPDPQIPLPRFDWIQKTDCVTFIFYAKQLCNSSIQVVRAADNRMVINLVQGNRSFRNELELNENVRWPCRTTYNYETGKYEIVFGKCESAMWSNYGTIRQSCDDVNMSMLLTENRDRCTIVDRVKVNHNTYLILLRRNSKKVITTPLGYHVKLFATIKGHQCSRSYTPIPPSLIKKYEPASFTNDCICLMVKCYSQGVFSSLICTTSLANPGASNTFEMSLPIGGFQLSNLEASTRVLLVAAGTGITPMFNVILFLLARRQLRCQKIKLLFLNKTEKDILWRDQLDLLGKEDDRLITEYVLSEANDKWNGSKGRVTMELLQNAISEVMSPKSVTSRDGSISSPSTTTPAHTILLIQVGLNPGTRTYSDYESVNECMEGVCKIYEEHLKRKNPDAPTITYDVSQLFDFVDQLCDLSCLVYQKSTNSYAPYNRDWIKQKIYILLRQAAGNPAT